MTIPASLVLVPLLIAFILEVLNYYRRNPEHVFSLPLVFLTAPLALFLLYLGLDTAGLIPAPWSALYLLVALAALAVAARRARFLKPAARST